MSIKELIRKWRESLEKKRAERIENEAKVRYQLQENDGQLWLTYRGSLVCPTNMLKGDAIESVNEMRVLYIKRAKDDDREI